MYNNKKTDIRNIDKKQMFVLCKYLWQENIYHKIYM